jgi:hypothetical protein
MQYNIKDKPIIPSFHCYFMRFIKVSMICVCDVMIHTCNNVNVCAPTLDVIILYDILI